MKYRFSCEPVANGNLPRHCNLFFSPFTGHAMIVAILDRLARIRVLDRQYYSEFGQPPVFSFGGKRLYIPEQGRYLRDFVEHAHPDSHTYPHYLDPNINFAPGDGDDLLEMTFLSRHDGYMLINIIVEQIQGDSRGDRDVRTITYTGRIPPDNP